MHLTKDRSFYRELITLALPISLQGLLTFLVGFVDNIMVSSLGDDAVSGVYLGLRVFTVFQLFILGMEGALLILGSQYWGKKDTSSIKSIVSCALKISTGFALLFSIACVLFADNIISIFSNNSNITTYATQYLGIVGYSFVFYAVSQLLIYAMRSVEQPKIGVVVSIITLVVDLGLNYILIFGFKSIVPPLGIKGAAIATLLARVIECIIIIFYVFRLDRRLCLRPGDIKLFDHALTGDFIRCSIPIVAGNVVWGVNSIAQGMILGRFDADIVAAVSIADSMNNLAYVWMSGLSGAVGIITAKTVGSGAINKVKEYAYTVQTLFIGIGILSGLTIFSIRTYFVDLYGVSTDAREHAIVFTAILAVTLSATCYQAACLSGLVKAGGDISFVFKVDMIFVLFVVIPFSTLAYLLGAAPFIVFAMLKVDQLLKCFVAIFKVNRFDWIKNLTRDTKGAGRAP